MAFDITGQLNLRLASGALRNISNEINSGLRGVGGARVPVRADMSGVKDIRTHIDAATSAVDRFSQQSGLAFKRFAAFSVAALPFLQVASGIQKAVTEGIEFDRQMVRLRQVASESASELGDIRNEVTRLSTTYGVSSQELVKMAVVLKQADFTARETKIALETLAEAALAPNFDSMTQTGEGAIAVMKQFGLQADQLKAAIGSMNAVAGAFAVEAGDLVEVVRRAGGAFKASGGDLNELLALFTSVRQTTRESAESIATGLRTIFTRIQRNDTVNALKEFGVNLRYTREEAEKSGNIGLTNQFVGAYEAISRLSRALTQMPSADPRFSAIVEDLGGYRQISKVIPLINEMAISERALMVAEAGRVSLQVSAAQAADSYSNRLGRLQEQYLAFGRSLLDTDQFKQAFTGFETLAKGMLLVLEAAKPLIPLLTTIATVRLAQNLAPIATRFFQGANPSAPGNLLGRSQGGVIRMASGGLVPGVGSADTVPANLPSGSFVVRKSSVRSLGLAGQNFRGDQGAPNVVLMPGEFVLTPEQVRSVGLSKLNQINKTGRLPGMAGGGPVGVTQDDVKKLIEKGMSPEELDNHPDVQSYLKQLISQAKSGHPIKHIDSFVKDTSIGVRRLNSATARGGYLPGSNQIAITPLGLSKDPLGTLHHEMFHAADFGTYRKNRGKFANEEEGLTHPTEVKPGTGVYQGVDKSVSDLIRTYRHLYDKDSSISSTLQSATGRAILPLIPHVQKAFPNNEYLTQPHEILAHSMTEMMGHQGRDFISDIKKAASEPKRVAEIDSLLANLRSTFIEEVGSLAPPPAPLPVGVRVSGQGPNTEIFTAANKESGYRTDLSEYRPRGMTTASLISASKDKGTHIPFVHVAAQHGLMTNGRILMQIGAKEQAKFQQEAKKQTEKHPVDQEHVDLWHKKIREKLESVKQGEPLKTIAAASHPDRELMQTAGGQQWVFNPKYLQAFRDRYKDAQFHANPEHEDGASVVTSGGKRVGLVMPMTGMPIDVSKLPARLPTFDDKITENFHRLRSADDVQFGKEITEGGRKKIRASVPDLADLELSQNSKSSDQWSITRSYFKGGSGREDTQYLVRNVTKDQAKQMASSILQHVAGISDDHNLEFLSKSGGLPGQEGKGLQGRMPLPMAPGSGRIPLPATVVAPPEPPRKGLEGRMPLPMAPGSGRIPLPTTVMAPATKPADNIQAIKDAVARRQAQKAAQTSPTYDWLPAYFGRTHEPYFENPRPDQLQSYQRGVDMGHIVDNGSISDLDKTVRGAIYGATGMDRMDKTLARLVNAKKINNRGGDLRQKVATIQDPEGILSSSDFIREVMAGNRDIITGPSAKKSAIAREEERRRKKAQSGNQPPGPQNSPLPQVSSPNPPPGSPPKPSAPTNNPPSNNSNNNQNTTTTTTTTAPSRTTSGPTTGGPTTGGPTTSSTTSAPSPTPTPGGRRPYDPLNPRRDFQDIITSAASGGNRVDSTARTVGTYKNQDAVRMLGDMAQVSGSFTLISKSIEDTLKVTRPYLTAQQRRTHAENEAIKLVSKGEQALIAENRAAEARNVQKQAAERGGKIDQMYALQADARQLRRRARFGDTVAEAQLRTEVMPQLRQTQREINRDENMNLRVGRLTTSLSDRRQLGIYRREYQTQERVQAQVAQQSDATLSRIRKELEGLEISSVQDARGRSSLKFGGTASLVDAGFEAPARQTARERRASLSGVLDREIRREMVRRDQTGRGRNLSDATRQQIAEQQTARVRQQYVDGVALQIQQQQRLHSLDDARAIASQQFEAALQNRTQVTQRGGQLLDTNLLNQGYRGGFGQRLRNAASSIGRGIRSGFSQETGYFGLQAAGSYAAAAFAPQAGAAEQAVLSGNPDDANTFTNRKALSGAFSGAASGAAVGFSLGGPYGAAAGAVGGALLGLATSIRDAAAEIGEAKIAIALKQTNEALTNFAKGTYNLNPLEADVLRKNMSTIEVEGSRKAARNADATGFGFRFMFGENAYLAEASKISTEANANQAAPMMDALTKIIEEQALGDVGNSARQDRAGRKASFNEALAANGGLGRSLLGRVASATQQDPFLLTEKLLKSFERTQENEARRREQEKGETAINKSAAVFSSLSSAVESASQRLARMTSSMKNLSDVMDSTVSSYAGQGLSEGLQRPFGATDEFMSSVRSVTGMVGGSPEVEAQANAIAVTGKVLPSIINAVRSQPVAALARGADMSLQVGDRLREALAAAGVNKAESSMMVSAVQGQLGAEDFSKLLRESGQDMGKLIQKLLGPMAEPLKQSFTEIGKSLDERAKTFADGLAELANRTRATGELIDKANQSRMAAERNAVDTAVRRRRMSEQGADDFNMAASARFQQERQTRLTGAFGNAAQDPDLIANQLKGTFADIGRAEKRVDAASRGGDIKEQNAAATQLTNLKSRAADLNQALKNLTDVSERTAAAQERLGKIQADREGRQALGMRYATANAEGRSEIARSFQLVNAAARMGTAAPFSIREQNQIFSMLSSMSPQMRLQGLGGVSVKELTNQLMTNTFGGAFDLDPQTAAMERSLDNFVQTNYETAARAAQLQVDLQKNLQAEFFARLGASQDAFLAQLAKVMQENSRMMVESQKMQAQSRLNDLEKQVGDASILGKIGVKTQAQFDSVKNAMKGGDEIQRIFAAGREMANVQATKISAAGQADQFAARIAANNQDVSTHGLSKSDAAISIMAQFGEMGITKREDQQELIKILSSKMDEKAAVKLGGNSDLLKQGFVEALTIYSGRRMLEQTGNMTRAQGELTGKGVVDPEVVAKIVAAARANGGDVTLTSLQEAVKAVASTNVQFSELNKTLEEFREKIKAMGRANGGPVRFFSKGGWGSEGSGTPHPSDTVNARIAPGEFVVAAAPARRNRAVLEHMNRGGLARFAEGGTATPKAAAKQPSYDYYNYPGKDVNTVVTPYDYFKPLYAQYPGGYDQAISDSQKWQEDARLEGLETWKPDTLRKPVNVFTGSRVKDYEGKSKTGFLGSNLRYGAYQQSEMVKGKLQTNVVINPAYTFDEKGMDWWYRATYGHEMTHAVHDAQKGVPSESQVIGKLFSKHADKFSKAAASSGSAKIGLNSDTRSDLDYVGRPTEFGAYISVLRRHWLERNPRKRLTTIAEAEALLRAYTPKDNGDYGDVPKIAPTIQGLLPAIMADPTMRKKAVLQVLSSVVSNQKNDDNGVKYFNKGGWGSGGSTTPHPSDTVNARIAPDEFVVSSGPAQKNRALLEHMNRGGAVHFAGGGPVTAQGSVAVARDLNAKFGGETFNGANTKVVADQAVAAIRANSEVAFLQRLKAIKPEEREKFISDQLAKAADIKDKTLEQQGYFDALTKLKEKITTRDNTAKKRDAETNKLTITADNLKEYHQSSVTAAVAGRVGRPGFTVDKYIKDIKDMQLEIAKRKDAADLKASQINQIPVADGLPQVAPMMTTVPDLAKHAYLIDPVKMGDAVAASTMFRELFESWGEPKVFGQEIRYGGAANGRPGTRQRLFDEIINEYQRKLGMGLETLNQVGTLGLTNIDRHNTIVREDTVNKRIISEKYGGNVRDAIQAWYDGIMHDKEVAATGPDEFAADMLKAYRGLIKKRVDGRADLQFNLDAEVDRLINTLTDDFRVNGLRPDTNKVTKAAEEVTASRNARTEGFLVAKERLQRVMGEIDPEKFDVDDMKKIQKAQLDVREVETFNNLDAATQARELEQAKRRIEANELDFAERAQLQDLGAWQAYVKTKDVGADEVTKLIANRSKMTVLQRAAAEILLERVARESKLPGKAEDTGSDSMSDAEKALYLTQADLAGRAYAVSEMNDEKRRGSLMKLARFMAINPNLAEARLSAAREQGPAEYAKQAALIELLAAEVGLAAPVPKAADVFKDKPFGKNKEKAAAAEALPGFAAGGLVPGVGNTDSVYAHLAEGSYVIRKSSVNSIGADNLHAMSKFASGGVVPAMVMPGEYVFGPKQAAAIGASRLDSMNKTGRLPAFGGGGYATPQANPGFMWVQVPVRQADEFGRMMPGGMQGNQFGQFGAGFMRGQVDDPRVKVDRMQDRNFTARQTTAASQLEYAQTKQAQKVTALYGNDLSQLKSEFFQIRNKLAKTPARLRTKEDIAKYRELLSYVNNPVLIQQDRERQQASISNYIQEFTEKPADLLDRLPSLRQTIADKKADYTERIRAKEQLDQIVLASRMVDQNMLREQLVDSRKRQIANIRLVQQKRREAAAVAPQPRPVDMTNPANAFHLKRAQEAAGEKPGIDKDNPANEYHLNGPQVQRLDPYAPGNAANAYHTRGDKDARLVVAEREARTMGNTEAMLHLEKVTREINEERRQRNENNLRYDKKASYETVKTAAEERQAQVNKDLKTLDEAQAARQADVDQRLASVTARVNENRERIKQQSVETMNSMTLAMPSMDPKVRARQATYGSVGRDYEAGKEKSYPREHFPWLYANGGIVPGTGSRDTVPALLTPGEMVVPKHQVQKFAAGGVVGGSTSGSFADIMDAASRFSQAATQIGQGLSGFSTSVNAFGESVGTFGEFVAKFDEAVGKIPEEITLSGVDGVSVNITGQDSIVKAVTEALGPMIAEAIRNSQPVEQRSS